MQQHLFLKSLLALFLLSSGPLLAAPSSLDNQYRHEAGRLLGAALVDKEAWDKLSFLTTHIGHRLSGSPQLEQAVKWTQQQMLADGLENVRLQPVKVPHWVRGQESAEILTPQKKPLNMLGLGNSIGTPPQGIIAPVIVVGSFDELEALGTARIKGKIVVYDMPWKGYSQTGTYRRNGASRAAKLGAVAVLVRSLTGRSLNTPHTGNQTYEDSIPKIPAAAITTEDAGFLRRLTAAGKQVQVHLKMAAKHLPDADSFNVMGEVVGREKPQEVVVLGGHLDSWDVGEGAHDDGSGVVATWQAVKLIKDLGLKPRRTIRVVAWTNEENGQRGGAVYHDESVVKEKHVAAIEMDDGAEKPIGFSFGLTDNNTANPKYVAAQAKLTEITRLLEAIETHTLVPGGGGADIDGFFKDGVPVFALLTIKQHYFDWHHTASDTLDKVNPQDLRRCTAALAVLAYILADMPEPLAVE